MPPPSKMPSSSDFSSLSLERSSFHCSVFPLDPCLVATVATLDTVMDLTRQLTTKDSSHPLMPTTLSPRDQQKCWDPSWRLWERERTITSNIALPTQPSNIPMEEFGGICNNRKSSNDIVKPRHCYTDLHINNSIYLTQTFQELSQGLNGIQTNETY